MPKPVPNEIREKIIAHKRKGVTENDIAKWLIISQSTVTKVWALFKRSGSYEPLPPNSGRKPLLGDEMMARIVSKIEETPDITLLELIDECSLSISESGLSKRLKKVNLTYKKRRSIQKNSNAKTSLLNAMMGR